MTNSVDSHHPYYDLRIEEWRLMRDSARGETAIKCETITYLPRPSGFKAQPAGDAMYEAYKMRAQFPEIVGPTVGGMIGVIHRTESQIEMPPAMQPLWEKATKEGLPLEALHARITAELLTTGRYGLLAGAASTGSDLPYIVTYCTEALINWSEAGDFYVLDETGLVRQGFDWVEEKQYRVLEMVDGKYQATIHSGDTLSAGAPVIPTARGDKALEQIPFVVMGARDLSIDPETPPLIGVARSAVSMYQLSADYRWQLFMTGQETLFIINGDEPEAVGAGVIVSLKADGEQTPDAKYVGPAGTGIAAHRTAITDERNNAVAAGARLFDTDAPAQESGDARRLRFAAQTATLVTIAQASAKGLEKALRYIAVMMGLDPEKVIVKPNLSFIDSQLTPAEVVDVIKGWQEGGYSYQTMYERLQKGEAVSAERTAEEEQALIDRELASGQGTLDESGLVIGGVANPADPAAPGNPAVHAVPAIPAPAAAA